MHLSSGSFARLTVNWLCSMEPPLGLNRISQDADALDFDFDNVAGFHENSGIASVADAAWRTGGDDIAWLEEIEVRIVLDQLRDAEDEVVGGCGLHQLAV